MGGVLEEGTEMGGFLLVFSLFLCSPSQSCLIPALWSTWPFSPKVREQSPLQGEEVKLSLMLKLISFLLRFTGVSWATPLHENPQAAVRRGRHAHAPQDIRARMHDTLTYHRHSITMAHTLCILLSLRKRETESKRGWVVKYRGELNQALNQECSDSTQMTKI